MAGACSRHTFLSNKSEESCGFRNRKTHHVEIIANYSFDEHAAFSLDSISARFIHRFACGNVFFNGFVGKFVKFNFGFLDERADFTFFRNRNTGINEVFFAGKCSEHGVSMFFILRFAEDFIIEHHNSIGTDYGIFRAEFCNSKCFFLFVCRILKTLHFSSFFFDLQLNH